MGCSGGVSTFRSTQLVLEMWSFTVLYFSGKGDHYYIETRQNDLFSHYNIILRKVKEKIPQKALVNTKRNVLMPPGHVTVKSNLFNMAAVLVKRSILVFVNFHNQSPLNKLL